MNPIQRTLAYACAAAFLLAGLSACGERISDTTVKAPKPLEPSPSAVVIGQAPAEPTGDPAGASPVAGNTTYVTKGVDQNAMPVPGQPNDHSNLAAKPPQKAETPEALHSVEQAKKANSGTSERSQ